MPLPESLNRGGSVQVPQRARAGRPSERHTQPLNRASLASLRHSRRKNHEERTVRVQTTVSEVVPIAGSFGGVRLTPGGWPDSAKKAMRPDVGQNSEREIFFLPYRDLNSRSRQM